MGQRGQAGLGDREDEVAAFGRRHIADREGWCRISVGDGADPGRIRDRRRVGGRREIDVKGLRQLEDICPGPGPGNGDGPRGLGGGEA